MLDNLDVHGLYNSTEKSTPPTISSLSVSKTGPSYIKVPRTSNQLSVDSPPTTPAPPPSIPSLSASAAEEISGKDKPPSKRAGNESIDDSLRQEREQEPAEMVGEKRRRRVERDTTPLEETSAPSVTRNAASKRVRKAPGAKAQRQRGGKLGTPGVGPSGGSKVLPARTSRSTTSQGKKKRVGSDKSATKESDAEKMARR